MDVQATTSLFIGGKEITNFKSYSLDQCINEHHVLEIICRMDVVDQLEESLANSSKNFLGQSIALEVISKNTFENYKPLQFKGVVVKIASKKGINNNNEVVITGYSPTIIADDGPHFSSYAETSLDEIVSTTLRTYDRSKLTVTTEAQYSSTVPYSVQHNESNWQYLTRLARQYGEWLYYNGQEMIFGKPQDTEELKLTQGKDLQSFAIELVPLPNRFNFFSGDYTNDEVHEKKTADVSTGVNGYTGFVSGVSEELYTAETKVWAHQPDGSQQKSQLDQQVELSKKAIEQQQFTVQGDSNNPGVTVGQKINITTQGLNEGSYRIVKVRHFNTSNGNYQNTFEALSSQVDVFPYTDLMAYPKSGSQIAKVTDNADPDGMSRIKVQFPWQVALGEMTPWLRVMTPHAGGGKGFQFTPEVGEEVIVGFEGDNAEKPYVMGALFTGGSNAGDWKSEKNDIKAIKTRSGHTISLSDSSSGGSITISDSSGNSILLDTAKSELTISAPEKIILSSKYIALMGDDVEFHSKNTKAISSEAFVAQTGGSNMAVLPDSVVSDSAEVSINGKETKINATSLTTNSKANTLINGAIVKLNS